jgi:hypothetical protein
MTAAPHQRTLKKSWFKSNNILRFTLMLTKVSLSLFAILLLRSMTIGYCQNVPAFSGAEGYGKISLGGRGGAVYEVTNLNDSGTGSLRAAVQATGARTVVFRVSGTIVLNSELKISNPYITIAGQTAPGGGICIANYPINIAANDVIIRYLRVRLGDQSGVVNDAVSSRFVKNLIVDHVSASWSIDETMSIYFCTNLTVQWCLVAESLYNSYHFVDGTTNQYGAHGFGGIWGSQFGSYHHNLLADHSSRNPRFSSGCQFTDYRNNVIYNWGYNSCYGGERQEQTYTSHAFSTINLVANYYKPGPATKPGSLTYRIANPSYRTVTTDYGQWYVTNNVMIGNAAVTADNWNVGVQPQGGSGDIPLLKLNQPWSAMAIAQQTAAEAYSNILDNVGAILPQRDSEDTRLIQETRFGTNTFEGIYKYSNSVPDITKVSGIIDSQTQVGGWPVLANATAPTDSDHDGMPDAWEAAHGLNPNSATDRNGDYDNDGFSNLEEYLNELGAFKGEQDIVWDGSTNNRYAMIQNWNLDFQPSRLDTAVISNATVVVDAIDQHAGILRLNNATLNLTNGWLAVATRLEIGTNCTNTVSATGNLIVSNLLNNGVLRLTGAAGLTVSGTFTNTGTLDVMTWNGTLPSGLVNTGTILPRSIINIANVIRSGTNVQATIQGFAGHSYQLQYRAALNSNVWQNVGSVVTGTNAPITFTHTNGGTGVQGYYRVAVN